MTVRPCPLCGGDAAPYASDRRRAYAACGTCHLVSADPASHLDERAERAVYDMHRNDPGDPRYRAFLGRLATPLLARLRPGMRGIDVGCGPGPTLSVMLAEAGVEMAVWDPHYARDRSVLATTYEVVTCTEVVEHFKDPATGWSLLVSLLAPGGWLGVMTKLVIDRERFASWHYKDDPTHVSFYAWTTLQWIAARHGLELETVAADAFLLRRES